METFFGEPPKMAVDTLHPVMVSVFKSATEAHPVRVCVQQGNEVEVRPYVFPLPAFPGVEETYDPRDFSLADALYYMDTEWEVEFIPVGQVLSHLITYTNQAG